MLFVIYAVLTLSAILMLRSGYSLRNDCIAEIEGTVTGSTRRRERSGGRRRSLQSHNVYYAIISYRVDDVEYKFTRLNGSRLPPVEGEKFILFYNPNNPKQCHEPGDSRSSFRIIFGWIFIFIFGGLMMLHLFSLL